MPMFWGLMSVGKEIYKMGKAETNLWPQYIMEPMLMSHCHLRVSSSDDAGHLQKLVAFFMELNVHQT